MCTKSLLLPPVSQELQISRLGQVADPPVRILLWHFILTIAISGLRPQITPTANGRVVGSGQPAVIPADTLDKFHLKAGVPGV